MGKTSTVLQLALLLSVWGTLADDIMSPTLNIIEELGKLRKLEERLKTMEEQTQNQSSSVTLLNSVVQELKRENEALQIRAKTSEEKLESLQKENEARKVAFSASLLASGSGHTGPFTSVKSPLIYKKVVTNFGNGYNSDTGIFTAPVKGVYYIRFYAHCGIGTRMAVSLYKNGNTQCSVFSWKPVSNGNASNGIVLTLEKGDEVFTRLWDNTWVYDDAASYTNFGGFLLFPL